MSIDLQSGRADTQRLLSFGSKRDWQLLSWCLDPSEVVKYELRIYFVLFFHVVLNCLLIP